MYERNWTQNGHKCVFYDLLINNKIYKCVQRSVHNFGYPLMPVPTQIPSNLQHSYVSIYRAEAYLGYRNEMTASLTAE